MLRLLLINCFLLIALAGIGNTVLVKNWEELAIANKKALPGDIIVLQNGEWNNGTLSLNCNGTKEQPITFKAQTPGKVVITGKSKLLLGGNYIIIDGLNFNNGYAGKDAIIKFSIDKDQIATNCRVTNTVINDFNNPRRLEENYWVAFYGKNNRVDHCSFFNKKNIGVLMAVILEDDRSRENFHSIDHNYFGFRLPLASNGGEMIRVGVSEHCEFNSNTQIADNFFEHCDGETEIISIKSCRNVIRNNLFAECQGAVVLRHGNYNTVQNNVFIGNNKEGTGGVRIINKGQWVVNNLFYKCRGKDFRSPLSIMNGVPNSPANRYVTVTDAVVANNSFFECSSIGFCEGSDNERSQVPDNVQFLNNIFLNSKDSIVYRTSDDIGGIHFAGNLVSNNVNQQLISGFSKTSLFTQKAGTISIPDGSKSAINSISDSMQSASLTRLGTALSSTAGFIDVKRMSQIIATAYSGCGAKWNMSKAVEPKKKQVKADCKTTNDIIQQLINNSGADLLLNLTGQAYHFSAPLLISSDLVITSSQKSSIRFSTPAAFTGFLLQISAGKTLSLHNINLDLAAANITTFISTDTSGSSNHSNFSMRNCHIENLNGNFLTAAKSSVSDSIIINNCTFKNGDGVLFSFTTEMDNRGYYNVEKLKITNNTISNYNGPILAMLRSGNDESTMGPQLVFSKNKINNCNTGQDGALINLAGTQYSVIEKNTFSNCNAGKIVLQYEDIVRAAHFYRQNKITGSGKNKLNKFVLDENNITQ